MAESKTIGVMTSGGDCAGLNAAIRAIAMRAIGTYGWRVIGLKNATVGLMARPVQYIEFLLEHLDSTILRQGGTMLGAISSGDPFAYPMPDGSKKDRTPEIIEGYQQLGLDALICIGGDGSQAGGKAGGAKAVHHGSSSVRRGVGVDNHENP